MENKKLCLFLLVKFAAESELQRRELLAYRSARKCFAASKPPAVLE